MNIDNMAEAFAEIQRHPLAVTYMQMSLADIRNMAHDTMREDLKTLLTTSADIPGEAIVVLTPVSVSLMVDDKGNLLSFA